MEIHTERVAASLLPLVFVCAALYGQTRPLSTSQILNLEGPSVVKIEVYNGQGVLGAQASGVVIAPGGIVATNAHVVNGACNVYIKRPSGSLIAALEVVRIDPDKDIAILRFDSKDLPAAVLGDWHALRVGDRVIKIGNPLGLEQTVSEGIVSGLRTTEKGQAVIQTTAPISPGSSGGGLFDAVGQLVGLTTFTLEGSQNLNFAVPLADVVYLLKLGPEKPWATASYCSEPAPALDAMVINQQLLGRELSDPQVAEVLKRLNGGTTPTPLQDEVLAGGEMRSYAFGTIPIKVWFQNGRCQSVLYFPGFTGIIPLGLSWDKSQSQVRELIGVPSAESHVGTDLTIDEYDVSQYRYSLWYAKDGKLTLISAELR